MKPIPAFSTFELPRKSQPPVRKPCALWEAGFRPFFLGAATCGLLGVGLWVALWQRGTMTLGGIDLLAWHRHEMIFGFTIAVIAGFLLTAPASWTGQAMPRGAVLAGMFGLWLAGRVAGLLPGLPAWLRVLTSVAFLPALALAVALPILRARQWRNLVFVVLLGGLAVAQLVMLLGGLGWHPAAGVAAGDVAVGLVLVMITIMGGRVIPFFTARALGRKESVAHPALNLAAPVLLALAVLLDTAEAAAWPRAGLWLAAGTVAAWRLGVWHRVGVWSAPLLWSLHGSFVFLVLGCLLKAGAALGWVAPMLARHALTVGTIGLICLGMMARVSRGHTGRPLTVDRLTHASLALAALAGMARALPALAFPSIYLLAVGVSGVLWCLALGLFLLAHSRMLVFGRPDGLPG